MSPIFSASTPRAERRQPRAVMDHTLEMKLGCLTPQIISFTGSRPATDERTCIAPRLWLGETLHGQGKTALAAADADVLKAHRAHAVSVEQVLGVNHDRPREGALDAIEVQGAEFRPAGANHESVGTFRCVIRRLAVAD